jgi:hypothetical protein
MWYCAAWSGLRRSSDGGDRWVWSNGGTMISRSKQRKFTPVPGISHVVARDLNLVLLGEKPASIRLVNEYHFICLAIIKPDEVPNSAAVNSTTGSRWWMTHCTDVLYTLMDWFRMDLINSNIFSVRIMVFWHTTQRHIPDTVITAFVAVKT